MKIIYVGPLNKGGTCLQRMQSMKDLGHEVTLVDIVPEDVRERERQFLYRFKRKILGPSDLAGVSEQILRLLREGFCHLLWIDKGLTVKAEALRNVRRLSPKTIIVGYSPDDMLNPDNQSRHLLNGLPYYDIYFTTKSYNVQELKDLGCKRVVFIENGYGPKTHRPMLVTKEDRLEFGGLIGFIGTYERERAESILYLAKNDIPVRVWGEGWTKGFRLSHPNMRIEDRPLLGDDYARAICSFDINLVFLRKINRDLQTTRSVEIPACGAFMLAERTDEHLSLFEENEEAAYFSSNDELFGQVRYFLKHEEERKRIAQSGRQRCLKGGYSYQVRMTEMFQKMDCFRDNCATQG